MPKITKSDLLDTLRQRILQLDIAPGSVLDEATLCEAYGVSRTPLREILHRLAGEGYARVQPNRGVSVSSMDIETMRHFFQTAPMIYASVARLAAENAVPEKIAALRAVQKSFRAAVETAKPRDMAISNHKLHEMIGSMAGNPYLSPSLQRLLIDHTRMSQTFYAARSKAEQALIQTACEQHDDMIDAFEARLPSRAVELALDHWALSRDRIERYVRPDPLPVNPHDTAEEVRDAV